MTRALLVGLIACGSPAPVAKVANTVAPAAPSYRIERVPIDRDTLGTIIDLQAAGPAYFTVYLTAGAAGEDRCAMVPRPDGDLAAACTKRSALTDVAVRSGLCDVPVSQDVFVERINRMAIDDCLKIKRTLEGAIRFEASADGGGVWMVSPNPAKRDVQKICARADRGGLSAPLCAYYAPQHTTEELRFFDERDTRLLARRLNELYGK